MILPDEVVKSWKKKIDQFTVSEMSWVYYLAPADWEVFCNYDLWLYFTMKWIDRGQKEKKNWKSKDLTLFHAAVNSGRLAGLLERPLDLGSYKSLLPDERCGVKPADHRSDEAAPPSS